MEEKFSIDEEMTTNEKYRVTLILYGRSKRIRLVLWFILTPVILLAVLNALLIYMEGSNVYADARPSMWPMFIFPGIVLFVLFGLPYLLFMASSKNIQLNKLLISDWGFVRKARTFEFRKPWNDFSHWVETKEFILLYFSENGLGAHVIQKRKLDSYEELQRLLCFLETKLPYKK